MGDTKTRPPKATYDHLKARQAPGLSVAVCLDDELAARVINLERKIGQATVVGDETSAKELTAELVELEADKEAASVTMRFRTIGRKKYNKLVKAHPPTAEQVAEYQGANLVQDLNNPDGPKVPTSEEPPYNPETFPDELIAATLVDPELTRDQLEELLDEWNETEWMQLWMAAMSVCSTSRVSFWGKD